MFKNIPNDENLPPISGEKDIGNGMKHAQTVQCQHTTTYGEKNIHKQTSEKKQEKKQNTINISHPPTPKTPFLFMVLTKTKQTFLSFLSWKFPNKNKPRNRRKNFRVNTDFMVTRISSLLLLLLFLL